MGKKQNDYDFENLLNNLNDDVDKISKLKHQKEKLDNKTTKQDNYNLTEKDPIKYNYNKELLKNNDFSKKENSIIHDLKNNSTSKKNSFYCSYELRLTFRIIISFVFLCILIILIKSLISLNTKNQEFYSENSNSSYSVCLKENKYYEESCLGENKQYLSYLVDEIPYVFTYNSAYNSKVDKKYTYNVDAHLKIFSQDNENQILYEKNFILMDNKEISDINSVFTISDSLIIPFKEYDDLVVEYSNNYSVLSTAEVTINFNVDDKAVSTLTIPLGKQTFSITKNDINQNVAIDNQIKNKNKKSSTICLIFTIIIGLAFILSVIYLLHFIFKTINSNEQKKYKNEVDKILKNYDRIIVEVKEYGNLFDNKTIVKVENILELIDVRDTLDKPILHVKINSIKDGFYVEDKDKIYSYTMKSKY